MKNLLVIVMLIMAILPSIAFAQSRVTNQNVSDTTPFVPWHTPERLEVFKKEPITTGHVIFLGNSITEGGNWRQLFNDTTIVNRGIGGDVTYGLLHRLDDIIKRQPSKLFILIGINDIGKDIPDAVIADNYLKIVNIVHAQSPATTIYVQSILPLNPTVERFPQHYDKLEHVKRVNKLLLENAGVGRYTFVNLYPLFLDKDKYLDAQYTVDGLHLKAAGYKVWVDYLKLKGYM